jgi:hypothetical protein
MEEKLMRKWSFMVLVIAFVMVCAPVFADVKVLFDENAATEAAAGNDIQAFFNQHSDGSTVTWVTTDSYKGKSCLFVTPTQSYNEKMTDWNFPITETPKAGEYRYIMFAWKSDGGRGVMVQFPDNAAWGATTTPCAEAPAPGTRRYIAGENVTGWTGICVSKEIPTKWTVVNRDLFADFGAFVMTGMALTPFTDEGKGDYYDMMVISSSPLDETAVESAGKLATTWGDMKR